MKDTDMEENVGSSGLKIIKGGEGAVGIDSLDDTVLDD